MGFWDKLFGNTAAPKAPSAMPPKSAPASTPQYDAVLKINKRNPTLGIPSYYSFSTLLSKGGTIFVGKEINGTMQPYGGNKGCVRIDDTSSYSKTHKVYCNNLEIGYLYPLNSDDSKGYIYLSLQGKYDALRKSYEEGHRLEPHFSREHHPLLVAEYSCGLICDETDGEILAQYTGNPVDAAAAFICYVYDMGGDNKFSRYYTTPM